MGLFGREEAARARFFGDLATSIDAGLPVAQALALVGDGRPPLARAARAARDRISQDGVALSEALGGGGALLALERHALEAGERSGRLPESLRALERHYEAESAALDTLHRGLVYPFVLLHLATVLPQAAKLLLESTSAFLAAIGPPLALLWGGILALVIARTAIARHPGARAARDRALGAIPAVGGLLRARAGARAADALSLLLSAGVGMTESLDKAAGSSGNEAVAAALGRARDRIIADGCSLTDALSPEAKRLPALLVESIRAGEAAGRLDETLARAARGLREQQERAMAVVVKLVPIAVYLAVAAYVAWVIIALYEGLYSGLGL